MSGTIDPRFSAYGAEVVEYLERNARTPGAILRILQRLHLPLPRTPEDATDALLRYFAERGTLEFKARMGMMKAAPLSGNGGVTPAKPVAPVSQPARPQSPLPAAAARAATPFPFPQAAAAPASPVVSPVNDLPEPLRGFPRECITPEALAAAKAGKSPFGEAPLLDRRSGLDRRHGGDRRGNVELVFRNQRYGRDRRSGKERRRIPAPLRDESFPLAEAIGSEALRRAGWQSPESRQPAAAPKKA